MIPKIKIPSIPFEHPTVQNAIEDGFYAVGPHINELENLLKTLFKFNHCITVSSGFSGLFLSLKALGIQSSHVVIPLISTCTAISNAVLATGNFPVFCDIDYTHFCLSTQHLEEIAQQINIGAIIAPSHFGIPAPIEEYSKFNVPIIEDACQSFLTRTKISSLADVVVFSFYPTKHFNCIDGGAVLTNNPDLNRSLIDLRYYGHQTEFTEKPRYNFKMQNINAAIGIAQLDTIPNLTNQFQQIKSLYLSNSFISSRVISELKGKNIIPWRFILKLTNNEKNIISNAGISVENELICLNTNKKFSDKLSSYFAIPYHHLLKEYELKYILKTINKIK